MEIISFVQDEQPSFSFPVFVNKKRKIKEFSAKKNSLQKKAIRKPLKRIAVTRQERSVFLPFETELKSFAAAQVHQSFSIRRILIAIGQGITNFFNFVKSNLLRIFAALLCSALTLFAIFMGGRFLRYKATHTGPLNIAIESAVDYENLNKLMASFALDSGVEYDVEGNLLDVENTSKLFTQPVTYQNYKVRSGDTISGITRRFGLSNISTIISVNDIGNVRQLAAGQRLKIPSIDGIVYTVKKGDSINSIVSNYGISIAELLDVNDLNSEVLTAGQVLFLPGASMDSKSLKNAMGDMFKMPITASFRWTSYFGPRTDPISGKKSSHTGVDMACPTGTPIYASMSGKVSYTGVSNIFGNYVIINHENGYQTLYAHMSKIIAKKGQWVSQGTKIGLVGSTGYSTGPHLHFTVYKNGKLIDPRSVLK